MDVKAQKVISKYLNRFRVTKAFVDATIWVSVMDDSGGQNMNFKDIYQSDLGRIPEELLGFEDDNESKSELIIQKIRNAVQMIRAEYKINKYTIKTKTRFNEICRWSESEEDIPVRVKKKYLE